MKIAAVLCAALLVGGCSAMSTAAKPFEGTFPMPGCTDSACLTVVGTVIVLHAAAIGLREQVELRWQAPE